MFTSRRFVPFLCCAFVVLSALGLTWSDEDEERGGRREEAPRLYNLTLEMIDPVQQSIKLRGESDLADGAIVTLQIEVDGFLVPSCMCLNVSNGRFEDVFTPVRPFRPGCYVFHVVFDSMLQLTEIKERYEGCRPPAAGALLQIGDYTTIRSAREKAKELCANRAAEVAAWLEEHRTTYQRLLKTLPNENVVTEWQERAAEPDKTALARTVETNRERTVNFTAALPQSGKAVTKAYSMLLGASSRYKRALRIAAGFEAAGEVTPEILVETGELEVLGALALIEQLRLSEDKAFGKSLLACCAENCGAFLAEASTEQRRLALIESPDERAKGWKEWRDHGEKRLADLCAGLEAPEIGDWFRETTPALRENVRTLPGRLHAFLESVEKRMQEPGVPGEVQSEDVAATLREITKTADVPGGMEELDDVK